MIVQAIGYIFGCAAMAGVLVSVFLCAEFIKGKLKGKNPFKE